MAETATQPDGERPGPRAEGLSPWRRRALLLLAPAVLIGPALLPGRLLLPQLPVHLAPLSAEYPEAAADAMEGANLLLSDRILPFLTDQLEIRRQVASGVLPTWEPKLGMGLPLFGGSLVSPAYPPNLLALVLPPDLAAGWLALFALTVGGAGFWVLARRRGLSAGAAAVGTVAFQTAGWALANLQYPMKVDAAVWLPWTLWAVEGLLQRRRGAGFLLFLFTAFSFLAGFVPIAVFCAAATAAYAAWRVLVERAAIPGGRTPARALAAVAGYLLLGFAGAGIQVLPTAEASALSARQPQDSQRVADQALPLAVAAGLVVPDLFGGPQEYREGPRPAAVWLSRESDRDALERFNSLEWNAFAGAAAVLLALVALVSVPRRAALPMLLLLACWGFAQGWPVMRFVYRLPGFGLGEPGRALALQWFLWPWLAALGTQAVLDRSPRALSTLLASAFLLSACAFLFWTGLDPARWAADLLTSAAARFDLPREEVARLLPEAARVEAGEELVDASARVLGAGAALIAAGLSALLLRRSPETFGDAPAPWKLFGTLAAAGALFLVPTAVVAPGLVLAPFALALGYALIAGRPRNAVVLAGWLPLALVVGLEGAANGAPHLEPRELRTELFPKSEALAAVARAAGDGRVLRLDESPDSTPVDVLALARPNLLEPYGVRDLTPFTVFTPRTLIELFEALDPRTRYGSGIKGLPDLELVDHPLLDLARVTAILSRRPLSHPRLEAVYDAPDFHVYHRTGVPPAVHVVRRAIEVPDDDSAISLIASGNLDPATEVVLAPGVRAGEGPDPSLGARESLKAEAVTPSRYDVAIESTAGGWLVFHEQFYPGWKAVLDGEDAEVLRVNHAQRAVRVPAGRHLVRTKYEPWSLRIGALLGLASLAAAAWCSLRPSSAG